MWVLQGLNCGKGVNICQSVDNIINSLYSLIISRTSYKILHLYTIITSLSLSYVYVCVKNIQSLKRKYLQETIKIKVSN